jgi:hypothetical protein
VLLFVSNGTVESEKVAAAVPEHVPFSYRLNTTVPAGRVPPEVVETVALSCGSQLCAVVMDVVSSTEKHSAALSVWLAAA